MSRCMPWGPGLWCTAQLISAAGSLRPGHTSSPHCIFWHGEGRKGIMHFHRSPGWYGCGTLQEEPIPSNLLSVFRDLSLLKLQTIEKRWHNQRLTIASPTRPRDNHISALLIMGDIVCPAYVCTHFSWISLLMCGPATGNWDGPCHQRFVLICKTNSKLYKTVVFTKLTFQYHGMKDNVLWAVMCLQFCMALYTSVFKLAMCTQIKGQSKFELKYFVPSLQVDTRNFKNYTLFPFGSPSISNDTWDKPTKVG